MTICFHGCPVTPLDALRQLAGRHLCVSYARPEQIRHARELAQSLLFDNGAFSAWRRGYTPDWTGFYAWCEQWLGPADWAVIPDVIGGGAADNDALIRQWPHGMRGAPVWHLDEPLERLRRLTDEWPRVCLGSAGGYAVIGTYRWEQRMDEACNTASRGRRFFPALHGLRMLACSGRRWPLASVDSTDIARNHNRPQNSAGAMAARWDAMQCPRAWVERAVTADLWSEAA